MRSKNMQYNPYYIYYRNRSVVVTGYGADAIPQNVFLVKDYKFSTLRNERIVAFCENVKQ